MNQSTSTSRRELIDAKREGFHEGAAFRQANPTSRRSHQEISDAAARRFPYTETKMRVVRLTGSGVFLRYNTTDRQLQWSYGGGDRDTWFCAEEGGNRLSLSTTAVKAAADLLANPTETVNL